MNITSTQLSKQCGISVNTLRYYERINIITDVPRYENGTRYYDSELQDWVEMIVCLRNSGVTIKSLQKYVQLIKQGNSTLKDREKLLENQKDLLIKKQQNIQTSINRLDHRIDLYKTGQIKDNKLFC